MPRSGWLVRPPEPGPYAIANEAMHDLARRRLAGEIPDTLILLEHPAGDTAGRRWKPEHIVWREGRMRAAPAQMPREWRRDG